MGKPLEASILAALAMGADLIRQELAHKYDLGSEYTEVGFVLKALRMAMTDVRAWGADLATVTAERDAAREAVRLIQTLAERAFDPKKQPRHEEPYRIALLAVLSECKRVRTKPDAAD